MRNPLLIGAACLLCLAVIAKWNAGLVHGSQDVGRYREIGRRVIASSHGSIGAIESEYPPLASAVFTLPYAFFSGEGYATGWILLLSLTLLGTMALLCFSDLSVLWVLPASMLLSTILIGPELVFARYDVLVGLLLYLCTRLHVRGSFRGSGFFFAFAACLKLIPILLAPFLFFGTPKQHRAPLVLGGVLGGLLGSFVPFVLLGPAQFLGNISYLFFYHGDRGVQVESTWSSLQMLVAKLHGATTRIELHALSYHNMDIPWYAVLILTALLALGIATLTVMFRSRMGERIDIDLLLSAGLFWILAVSPVLSPQYFLWVLPLFFAWCLDRLCSGRKPERLTHLGALLAAAVAVATQWIYPWYYNDLVDKKTLLSISVLLTRNTCTFLLCALCMDLLQQSEKAPEREAIQGEQSGEIIHLPS